MFRTEAVSLDGFAPVLAQFDDNVRWNGFLCPSRSDGWIWTEGA